jgi:iron(III) transport system substrate-binding protein
MTRYLLILCALIAVIAAPMILRPAASVRTEDYAERDRLVVITPHVETLRYELERGFTQWMQEKHGRRVVIDWRVPGGTSDIIKVVNSEFAAAKELGPNRGIGLDIMTGGGPIDYLGLKKSGHIAATDGSGKFGPAAVKAAHPDWFTEDAIPAKLSGQELYDPELTWIGTCLSSFGICWNIDNLERRGMKPPQTWSDLADPAYENQLAVSDPTKSGTVTAMFECMLQISMAGNSDSAAGWAAGLRQIRRIGANTRYWTDSSTKIPLDVSEGEALAGMCVDFYGRNVMERLTKVNGASRLGFLAPPGGTTISPQPVAMIRNAANPELATRFIEFLLSPEGQKLWGLKAGAPGGPEKMALRNMAIRRDYYTEANLAHAADPELRPLEPGMAFQYEPKYTADLFASIRFLIRAMCIDPHHELKDAWYELIAHGFPPEATAVFDSLPPEVGYGAVREKITSVLKAKDAVATARLARELSETFRQNYLKARDLARAGK